MTRVRSLLFWTHLAVGLTAGLLILLMSVTGVLLGFERQMIAAIDGAPRVADPTAPRLPVDSVLGRAGIATHEVASLVIRRDPTVPFTVRFHERDRNAVQVDPTTGEALAAVAPGKGQRFFSALRRWHRWVGATGAELRAAGKAATGAANLAFLGLIISGFFLWWPRHWSLARWRATAVPSLGKAGKARDFNWHNSLGFWSAIPLALVVASGVFISYQWPGRWLDRLLGSPSERAAAIAAARPAPSGAPTAAATTAAASAVASFDALLAPAISYRTEWQQLTLTLPATSDDARIVVAEGNTYRPDLRTTFVLARATAEVRERTGFADLSTSRQIRAWVRFGHTGEVFGLPGQLIATLVTLAGCVLVWTGVALSWRRFRSWRTHRGRHAIGEAALAG